MSARTKSGGLRPVIDHSALLTFLIPWAFKPAASDYLYAVA